MVVWSAEGSAASWARQAPSLLWWSSDNGPAQWPRAVAPGSDFGRYASVGDPMQRRRDLDQPLLRRICGLRLNAVAAVLWLAALFVGCATAPPPAKPVPPPKPIPLAQILAGVEAELTTMQKVYDLRLRSGHLLAELNRRLQQRGFSRRVPARPAEQSLESDLRAHARAMSLEMSDWQVHVRPTAPVAAKGPQLGADQTWELSPDDLKGVIDARVTIKGSQSEIISFIDRIPNHVERAVWVTGQTPVPGGIRFALQAFYERTPPRPFTDVHWPTLEDRLEAAGWGLSDPKLPTDPAYPKLQAAIKQGRARIPDLRSAMDIANDFPRWFARAGVLDELTDKIMAVSGAALLRTTPIPVAAPFPPVTPASATPAPAAPTTAGPTAKPAG